MIFGNANLSDTTGSTEEVSNGVLAGTETNVSDKESAAFSLGLVVSLTVSSLVAGELNLDLTTGVGGVVFSVDSFLSVGGVFVLDEGNAAGATSGHNELALAHFSVLAEDVLEGILVNIVTERLNEDLAVTGGLGVLLGPLLGVLGVAAGGLVAIARVHTAAASTVFVS